MKKYTLTNPIYKEEKASGGNFLIQTINFELNGAEFILVLDLKNNKFKPLSILHTKTGLCPSCKKDIYNVMLQKECFELIDDISHIFKSLIEHDELRFPLLNLRNNF